MTAVAAHAAAIVVAHVVAAVVTTITMTTVTTKKLTQKLMQRLTTKLTTKPLKLARPKLTKPPTLLLLRQTTRMPKLPQQQLKVIRRRKGVATAPLNRKQHAKAKHPLSAQNNRSARRNALRGVRAHNQPKKTMMNRKEKKMTRRESK